MWKKLKAFIQEMEGIVYDNLTEEEKAKVKERLLTKIAFFQHERLIHLIVTVTFAILAIITLVILEVAPSLGIIALEMLLIILLIPYIVHYYHLENGVQKLYEFYEKF